LRLSEDPVEESETPHHGPDARKDDPCSEMGSASQRNSIG